MTTDTLYNQLLSCELKSLLSSQDTTAFNLQNLSRNILLFFIILIIDFILLQLHLAVIN